MKCNVGYWVEERGLQTKYVARKLGVSETQVSKWKTGKAYPRVDKLFKLALLLNVKVDDLYEVLPTESNTES